MFTLMGGIAMFLYGMDLMGKALEQTAGSKLQGILSKMTASPVRGLLLGLYMKKKGYHLSRAQLVGAITAAALVVTALNTVVMYLDRVIQGYYSYAYVFGGLTLRVISGIATAVIMSFVAPPVVKLLERTMAQVKK